MLTLPQKVCQAFIAVGVTYKLIQVTISVSVVNGRIMECISQILSECMKELEGVKGYRCASPINEPHPVI